MIGDRAWCSTCRRMREVMDEYLTDRPTAGGIEEYMAVALECGHNADTPSTVVAAAPGAPDAGVRTARSTRLVDLWSARRRGGR